VDAPARRKFLDARPVLVLSRELLRLLGREPALRLPLPGRRALLVTRRACQEGWLGG
jgi:hypothetical protein